MPNPFAVALAAQYRADHREHELNALVAMAIGDYPLAAWHLVRAVRLSVAIQLLSDSMNLDPYSQPNPARKTDWAPGLTDVLQDNKEHPPHILRLGHRQKATLDRVVSDVTRAHRLLDGYEIPGGLLADRIAALIQRARLKRPE